MSEGTQRNEISLQIVLLVFSSDLHIYATKKTNEIWSQLNCTNKVLYYFFGKQVALRFSFCVVKHWICCIYLFLNDNKKQKSTQLAENKHCKWFLCNYTDTQSVNVFKCIDKILIYFSPSVSGHLFLCIIIKI